MEKKIVQWLDYAKKIIVTGYVEENEDRVGRKWLVIFKVQSFVLIKIISEEPLTDGSVIMLVYISTCLFIAGLTNILLYKKKKV